MLFDELPDELTSDDFVRAGGHVMAIEVDASLRNLHAFGDALGKRGADLRSGDEVAGVLVIVDGLVCQLWLGNEQSVARWGGAALGPMMEMNDGVFPPPVAAFPSSLLPYVEHRAITTGRADAQARYRDFLWLHRGTYLDGRDAIRAYRRAGVGSNPADATDHMTAASYLIRAAQLSMRLNFERPEIADVLIREIRGAIHDEGGGFVWQLAASLGRLARYQPDAAAELLEDLVAESRATSANPRRERTTLDAVEAIAAGLGRSDVVAWARRASAESHEREATQRAGEGAMIEVGLLRDALRAFERIGDGDAVRRLKDRYADAASRATEDLSAIKAEVQIPNEVFEEAFEHAARTARTGDVGLLQLPLELGVWPSWEDVQARFQQARQEHPIQWLVSRYTVSPDGRVVGPPEDEADRDEAYLHDYFTQEIQMVLGLNAHLIGRLRESGDWSVDALMANLRLADAELAAASESGIRAFETGDSWTACHVLIPQFERGLRKVALRLSANVRRVVADQGLQVATLGSILTDEAVVRFLGANLAQTLDAVFTKPRGLNLRNSTAHGLLAPEDDQQGAALLTVFGLLTAGYCLWFLDQPPPSTAGAAATPDATRAQSTRRSGVLDQVTGSRPPPSVGPCQFLTLAGRPCPNPGRYAVDGYWSCSRKHPAGPQPGIEPTAGN